MRQLEPLPGETRQLLLLAAAEPVGDVTLLRRAAELLGIGADEAAPAEAAGLIDIGARVRFRHPLVRSAAYRAASVPDRRDVHRALAEATDPQLDPDRRAWHRAHAAARLDETVADELERSAGRARNRGGIAAAAAFLERAAELTPDPADRGRRALAAAQAKFESGAPEAAHELLAVARDVPAGRAPARAARPSCAPRSRSSSRAAATLRPCLSTPPDGSNRSTPRSARQTYLEALGAAMYAGRLDADSGVRQAAEAARAAPAAPQPPRSIDLVLDGLATRFTDGPAAGVPPLRRALEAVRQRGSRQSRRDHALALAVSARPVDDGVRAVGRRRVPRARDARGATGS